uniref:Coiled-coil-helix-coiled-coil-helix domain containing 3a n=1 Tax=Amphilophus citrinellus TaxID=61819 RepID=A0A3Q0SRZ1_AMPCI
MGANNSTRRVSFESDENDNITVVKGIRVSDMIELKAEKARASAQAQAEAKSQVQGEVSRLLTAQRATAQESLHQAFIKERISTEDEKLRAKQLEAKEADLKKQDAFYREQVARLEERSSQFYKVTSENFHKAADQVNAKFRRYDVYPVCADLQEQILTCYKENVGKTLHCSNIAARYLQCVNNAKQVLKSGERKDLLMTPNV